MLVIPAIDLLGGRVVRLAQGRREAATVYHERPVELARALVAAGATRLHVVDLDGAFAGRPQSRALLAALCAATAGGAAVQVGGGVRDLESCRALLEDGAQAVVLGTAAVRDPALVEGACGRWPGRVVVAVDARAGRVAVAGWTEQTEIDAAELGGRAARAGAAAILYTDIARDGMRRGPAIAETARLARALAPVPVIASGGVGTLDDLRALARAGVPQCVVGRALYERVFTLEEALTAAALPGGHPGIH